MPQERALAQVAGLVLGIWGLAASVSGQDLDDVRDLMRAERYQQALDLLKTAGQAAADDSEARFLQGVAMVELGRTNEALGVFERLTQDHPGLPEPHNNLAVLYAAQGDHARARDALLVAISTHPSYATAHENLGDIYAQMAGMAYDKALELDGQTTAARAKLELIHEMLPGRGLPGASAAPVTTSAVPSPPTPTPTTTTTSAVPTSRTPAAASLSDDTRAAVLATVTDWARAWSSQDVERYLGFYASGFGPADGSPRATWARLRRTRLQSPGFVAVALRNVDIEPGAAGDARVTFIQDYRSDTFSDQVRKLLTLRATDGEWKITSEQSIP